MQEREQVVVLGPEESSRALASRIGLLGTCRGVPAVDLEGALRAQAASPRAFRVGFLASDHGLEDPPGALRAIAEQGAGGGMGWVAFGPRPSVDEAGILRRAGVRFALFDPASDEELRFVLNQALHQDATAIPRADPRVPADLPARIVTKNGEKVALIYNLSEGGAYVATPRPTLRGGSLQLLFSLPGGEVRLDARVMWNNVPGNLRRANAPIGMGLRFTNLSPELRQELRAWIEQRAQRYRL